MVVVAVAVALAVAMAVAVAVAVVVVVVVIVVLVVRVVVAVVVVAAAAGWVFFVPRRVFFGCCRKALFAPRGARGVQGQASGFFSTCTNVYRAKKKPFPLLEGFFLALGQTRRTK